ncbi:MAG: hypothetical protein Q9191_000125 [Dirinaria sp. TL-2023a]
MSFDRKPASPIADPDDTASKLDGSTATQDSQITSSARPFEYYVARLPQEWVVPLSGATAGALAGIVSCPLDVIKTKLQAQGGFQPRQEGAKFPKAAYRGVQGTAAMIWKEDGLRGMYRGLGPMLLGYVPTWAIYLTVYNKTQAYFRTKTDNWFFANICASLSGGACSTMATNPIWVVKTRLMSQSSASSSNSSSRAPWQYHSTFDAIRKMYRAEGIKPFYSGLTPAMLGLTHVAIQFPLYEVFKKEFTGLGGASSEQDKAHHFYGLSLAVFLSKVCASTATYPHEVVRTRLQTQQRPPPSHSEEKFADRGRPPGGSTPKKPVTGIQYRGTLDTCKVILAEEGWRGFYAGLGTNLIRAVPSAMTTILTFEYLKKTLFQIQDEARSRGDGFGSAVA